MMDYPIGKYCIVRAENAGVFAGTLAAVDGDVATVTDARRIWYWAGAASLSQLANDGTSRPDKCKFPAAVSSVTLRGWIEIIPTTEAARASIDGVTPWKM